MHDIVLFILDSFHSPLSYGVCYMDTIIICKLSTCRVHMFIKNTKCPTYITALVTQLQFLHKVSALYDENRHLCESVQEYLLERLRHYKNNMSRIFHSSLHLSIVLTVALFLIIKIFLFNVMCLCTSSR